MPNTKKEVIYSVLILHLGNRIRLSDGLYSAREPIFYSLITMRLTFVSEWSSVCGVVTKSISSLYSQKFISDVLLQGQEVTLCQEPLTGRRWLNQDQSSDVDSVRPHHLYGSCCPYHRVPSKPADSKDLLTSISCFCGRWIPQGVVWEMYHQKNQKLENGPRPGAVFINQWTVLTNQ